MNRRRFLQGSAAGLAAASATRKQQLLAALVPAVSRKAAGALPALAFQGVSSGLRITDVEVVYPRPKSPENFWGWLQDTIIANPMSIYPKYKQKRASWRSDKMRAIWVRFSTNKGVVGYGKG